ncbi:MAG: hypothetical protein GEU71_14775 [Actinobacteria bacterium]|nr:hypothetical protein [Actinomycetota bacterium]
MPVNRVYKDRVRAGMHFGHDKAHNTGIAAYTSLKGLTAALTGTATPSATEAEIVTGGQTIIITLTGSTWVAAGATFNAQRQAIIDGLTSAQSEATGWNAVVRDVMAVTAVVRTSSTVVTVTTPAAATYAITADETVTVTVPLAAIDLATSDVVAGSFLIVNA